MRVIGGSAGGTRLARVPAGTRPVSDRAREGLFSSLGGRVIGAACADLFAGTGAMGIEVLSRGADSCLFVDRSGAATRTIRENLRRTGFEDRAKVIRRDLRGRLPGGRFDLVLLDPPYAFPLGALRGVLRQAAEALEPGGTLVLTRAAGDDTDVIPVDFQAAWRLRYGDTRILIYR